MKKWMERYRSVDYSPYRRLCTAFNGYIGSYVSIPDSEKGVSVNDYGKWREAEKNHATEPSPI